MRDWLTIVSNIVSEKIVDFRSVEMASFSMAGPLFSLDVILDMPQPTPMVILDLVLVVVPKLAPSYEELASKLGLNMVLNAEFIAMLSILESSLDVPGGDNEAQASEFAQFLSEDPQFQRVLPQGGSNPLWVVDHWVVNRLSAYRTFCGLDISVAFEDLHGIECKVFSKVLQTCL